MSTIYELVYHEELNLFHCFCGYMGLFHHCTRKIKGSINIVIASQTVNFVKKKPNEKNIILFDAQPTKMVTQFVGHVMKN